MYILKWIALFSIPEERFFNSLESLNCYRLQIGLYQNYKIIEVIK